MNHSTAQDIERAIGGIPLFDSHEHLVPEAERTARVIDFSELFLSYAGHDLLSAGMTIRDYEAFAAECLPVRFQLNERIHSQPTAFSGPVRHVDLDEKWRILHPWWESIRNTAYSRAVRIAIRDLYGIDDLHEKTFRPLSEAMQRENTQGVYRRFLHDRGGIERAILDIGIQNVDSNLFSLAFRFDHFVTLSNRRELGDLEGETGHSIHSVRDLERALEASFDTLHERIIAVKSALAYLRTLSFDNISMSEADTAFARIFGGYGDGLSWGEAKPLQDYMFHCIVRQAEARNLPIQIHTGFQAGHGNMIHNADPTRLANIFLAYPRVKFDLFHGGFPWGSKMATLAKNFPNVYPDLCWVFVISPAWGRRTLREWIETVPGNKILGFGGDYIIPEGSYAHSVLARKNIARVLAERVKDGYFSMEEALVFARRILHDNGWELFFPRR
jgi:hypothetical protein